MSKPLADLVAERTVLVCCGPGGVGKTTVAAALGLAAAHAGRSACVVTIDPARRLADALGVEVRPNVAHEIEGTWPGRLAALMLDAASTFDDLVARYASSPEQVARITSNRLYQNLVGSLSGTQEYMATERLFELHAEGSFDLIVVDTPPSRHALDFLSAPSRLTGFLDNRLFRLLLAPGGGAVRAVNVATQLLLRTIAKVAGSEIVEDTIAFFQAFQGMEQGFRDRAKAVDRLLGAENTAFILVTTARKAAIVEAGWLGRQIAAGGRAVDALVVNRMLPSIGAGSPTPIVPPGSDETAWAEIVANAAMLAELAESEAAVIESAAGELGDVGVVRIPMFNDDVHDLVALERLARHLVPGAIP